MRRLLVAVVWVLSDLDLIFGIDWCSLNCRDGTKNSMCKYTSHKNHRGCVNIRGVMTPTDRTILLELHNGYRNKLAGGQTNGWPKAANMRRMSWDCDLETVAHRWAVQCEPGHDQCRRTPTFVDVGQNYAMAASTGEYPNFNSSFNGWVDEIKLLTPAAIDSFAGGSWGHFTQVIWAESYKLGCALINYEEKVFKNVVLICNYGPSGNFLGSKIYEKGEPCREGQCKDPNYPHLTTGSDNLKAETINCQSAARSAKNFSSLLIATAFLTVVASASLYRMQGVIKSSSSSK